MKENKAFRKFMTIYDRIRSRFSGSTIGMLRGKLDIKPEKLQSIAYNMIGEKTRRILPVFEDVSLNLQKAGMKTSFKAYVSLALLTAVLVASFTVFFVPCLLYLGFGIPFLSAILFGLGGSLFALAFSIIGFYVYPIYRSDKLRRELEDELLFTSGYVAILTSVGVSPERIFISLSNHDVPLVVSGEAKDIVRDLNLFGLDIISALEKAAKRTPSERFREMLEGFISTVHSGSDSTAYMREKSRQYMKLKSIDLKKFSDTLSILSEFYVAILLTGPLLLVIMLAVMAMLGGGGVGFLSPSLLLNLLAYLGIPIGSVMFLIVLDMVTPKW